MSKPRALISPFSQAEQRDNLNTLEAIKLNRIKKAFLAPGSRGVFTTQGAMRALAVRQDSIESDVVKTIDGVHPRSPLKSKVLRLSVDMQDVNEILSGALGEGTLSNCIFNLLSLTRMTDGTDSEKKRMAHPFIVDNAEAVIANVIRVKNDTKSKYTKSIQFIGQAGASKTLRFALDSARANTKTSGQSYTLYVAKNDHYGTAYLRLTFAVDGEGKHIVAGSTTNETSQKVVRECVLIFNGPSSVNVKQISPLADVRKNKASWETAPSTVELNADLGLDTVSTNQPQYTRSLLEYLEAKFPNIRYVRRDNCDEYRADQYMQHCRAVRHDLSIIHYTYAYLRAFAAVLVRNKIGYSDIKITFDGITNSIQDKINKAVENALGDSTNTLKELIMSVICAAELVNALMVKHADKINAHSTTLNAQIKKLYIKHKGFEEADATYATFGNVLAVHLFETTDPSKTMFPPSVSWVKDYSGKNVSSHEWKLEFKLTLCSKILRDLRTLLEGQVSWLDTYNFLKEEKDSKKVSNKHVLRVNYKVTVQYAITIHHPYASLYGTTVH